MRIIVTALVLTALAPSVVRAQAEEGCEPGEDCEPPPGDEVTDGAPAIQEAAPPACFPACRDGYLCDAGQCVEACNPPCGPGTSCSAQGACEADAPAAPLEGPRDGGYAIGGGVMGIVMAALTIGLHLTVAAGDINYWVEVGLSWGGIGLPFITAPIVGGAALSASGPGVTGILPLRVGAWIAYGIYLIGAGGAAIYAADHQGAVPDELLVTLAVFGVATELAFSIDAIYTGSQANEPVSAVPVATLVTSPGGVDGAVLGAMGAF